MLVSGLVTKTDYNAKILDIVGKYFTTSDYNKFIKEMSDAKIKEKGTVDKSDISNLVKNSDLNTKPTILASKAELKEQHLIQVISMVKIFLLIVINICLFMNQHLIRQSPKNKNTEYVFCSKSKRLFKSKVLPLPNIKYFG